MLSFPSPLPWDYESLLSLKKKRVRDKCKFTSEKVKVGDSKPLLLEILTIQLTRCATKNLAREVLFPSYIQIFSLHFFPASKSHIDGLSGLDPELIN